MNDRIAIRPMMRVQICRGANCGAKIRILDLENGNRMPVDLEPADDGRVMVLLDGKARVLGARDAEIMRQAGHKLLRSHFASCPNGPQFRKRQRSR